MLKYIGKRILMMLPILFGITVIVFTLMYVTPGDPAYAILGENATPEQVAEIHEEYGWTTRTLCAWDGTLPEFCTETSERLTKPDSRSSARL